MFKKHKRKIRYIKSGVKLALIPAKVKLIVSEIAILSTLSFVKKVVTRLKRL